MFIKLIDTIALMAKHSNIYGKETRDFYKILMKFLICEDS
jgi:hypothetical protein